MFLKIKSGSNELVKSPSPIEKQNEDLTLINFSGKQKFDERGILFGVLWVICLTSF